MKKELSSKVLLFSVIAFVLIIILFAALATLRGDYNSVVVERDEALSSVATLTEDKQALQSKYDKLKADYDATIEPYKDLSEAELLAKTAETSLKAAEDQKALEKLEAEKAKEQVAKEKKEKEVREKEEKVGYNTGITYEQLARTPDDYEDKKVKFTGEVIQVVEGDSSTQIRLAIDSDYDKVIYIEYASDIVDSRVLEDDIITIYGVSKGLLSYESTIGGTITIPSVLVDKIDQ
jgi:hypothetical protein